MEIKPPKLYSATVLQLLYLLLGMTAIFWNYLGIFDIFLAFLSLYNFGLIKLVISYNFIDTYFLTVGILSIFASFGLVNYTKQSLKITFFANLGALLLTVLVLTVPVFGLYISSGFVDKMNILALLLIFYLPLFLPIGVFEAIATYFILRNLSYISFFSKQEADANRL